MVHIKYTSIAILGEGEGGREGGREGEREKKKRRKEANRSDQQVTYQYAEDMHFIARLIQCAMVQKKQL